MMRQLQETRYCVLLVLTLAASIAGLGGGVRSAEAQSAPELWLMASGDSVILQISDPPASNRGFVVDRLGPGGEWERITPEAVTPVRMPTEMAAILGDARADIWADLRVTNDSELLRRLRADPFTAHVASMVYPEVAQVLGRRYVDTGLSKGAEYEYRVTFVDRVGEETGEERRGSVSIMEVLPGTPDGVEAEVGAHGIDVSWHYPDYTGGSTDFVYGFHLERAVGEGGFERITGSPIIRGEGIAREWRDEEVSPGEVYRYRVLAVDMAGRSGEPSEVITVEAVIAGPPGMPERLVAEPGDGEVELSWLIAPEPDVVGYWVERSEGLDEPYERIVEELVPAESPSYRDETVRGRTQYFYRIIAVNSQELESRPSNAMSVVPYDRTPPEPATSLDVDVEVDARALRLSWQPSPSDDVLGYYVYRGASADQLIRLTGEPLEGTEYVDSGVEGEGLNPGGRYTVQVVAVDHSFNESEPVSIEIVVPDEVPPDAPTGLHANNVHGRYIEVRWTASPSLDVEFYELSRRRVIDESSGAEEGSASEASDATLIDLVTAGERTVRDTAVSRGEQYRYELIAIDSAGNRGEMAVAEVDFRGYDPPPASRHATAVVTEDGTRVRWERVSAPELVGYRVYRATSPTGVYESVSDLITTDDEREFIDPDGREGHFYTVRAVDVSGNESRPSPAARVRTP